MRACNTVSLLKASECNHCNTLVSEQNEVSLETCNTSESCYALEGCFTETTVPQACILCNYCNI
jgi:hypothetical protein